MKTLFSNEDRMTFRHLYDTTWGCFVIHNNEKWIVFPQDFQPEVKRKYDVLIQWTQTGSFRYKDKTYAVARAHLKESTSMVGAILYAIDNKSQKLESPLAAALKEVKL